MHPLAVDQSSHAGVSCGMHKWQDQLAPSVEIVNQDIQYDEKGFEIEISRGGQHRIAIPALRGSLS
jgi:hypothetical protein